MHAYTHMHLCIYMQILMHTHALIHMCTYMHTENMHTHIHIPLTHTGTHAHMHMYTIREGLLGSCMLPGCWL